MNNKFEKSIHITKLIGLALGITCLVSMINPTGFITEPLYQTEKKPPGNYHFVALAQDEITPQPQKTTWLCGKLLFLNGEPGVTYLGLDPCPRNQLPILIFKIRPRELWTYYQFLNPVIEKGLRVETNLGPVEYYITTFDNYIPLNSCSDCLSNLYITPVSGGSEGASDTPVGGFIFPSPRSSLLTTTQTPTLTATQSRTPTPTTSPTPPPPTASDTAFPSSTATQPLQPESTPTSSKGLCPGSALILLPLVGLLMHRRLTTS